VVTLAEQLVAQGVSQPIAITNLAPTAIAGQCVVKPGVVMDPDNVAGTV
jgi:hypothetical protein